MTGFYERSAILSRSKERFTDFNTLNAYLISKGSTFGRSIPLYAIGSDGNDSNIIGHWGYDSDGKIVPMGVIRFDRITDGGTGLVNDDFNGTLWLKSFDVHYEIDSFGSRQEYIK